ncbi:MAG TPA: type I-E CRISPR-associated protein Cse1/CasA [Roseiflexaceae bacterium]|nr:type I-E CRISPR-associated protein Cse1/CasA [Roseiflexaceae bacterium]
MTEAHAHAPPSFNLWRDPWIRATRPDGTTVELGIGACLVEAHALYALHDPSPLVVAGTHRLLTAILQAIYAPESLDEIEELLAAGRFDPARLEAFAEQNGDRFELFHPTTPFLQTGDVPLDGWRKPAKAKKGEARQAEAAWVEPKPVAPLFAEVPATTYRAHFHHVTDESHRVCPACCARGLVTIPAFASSGGAGIRPSINGVPPIYVLPAGETLFRSLALSLTAPGYQPQAAEQSRAGVAAWNGGAVIGRDREIGAVGYVESLTFAARRVRLFPRVGRVRCTHCGKPSDIAVPDMLYEMGHRRGENAGAWDDPFVAFRQPGGRGKRDGEGLLPVRPQTGKALWREYTGLLLARPDDEDLRPKIVRQVGRLVDRGALGDVHLVRFRCVGVRTDGKAKVFEWLDDALESPPRLLIDLDGALVVEDALRRAGETEQVLIQTFNKHFRPERTLSNPAEKTARFKTLRARMQAEFWQRLAPEFRKLIFTAADPAERPRAAREWADVVVRTGTSVFEQAADQVGERADALRARVLAQAECRRRLAARRKEWFGEQ